MKTNLNFLKQKIIYRSKNRGCKESELIFATFIKKHLDKINNKDLYMLNFLLSYDDVEILDWVYKKKPPPMELKNLIETINNTITND